MPKTTLFGVIESKSETRERVKRLVHIQSALAEAPGAIECRLGQAQTLQYFIDRSNAKKIDMNDRDGLMREIGDPEELLTERDCAFMRRQKKLWKPIPNGWIGGGGTYCCALHPKEVRYIAGQRDFVLDEIFMIEENVPLLEIEAAQLRAVGPIPKELAEQYRLKGDDDEKLRHGAIRRILDEVEKYTARLDLDASLSKSKPRSGETRPIGNQRMPVPGKRHRKHANA